VRAIAGGQTLLVGTRRLLEEQGIAIPEEALALLDHLDRAGETPLLVARAGVILGAIGARDRVRPDAAAMIADLRASGIETIALLTGDRAATARSVAEAVGIDEFHSEMLPDQKADWVASGGREPLGSSMNQAAGARRSVAFVGDGINDAPALARATVGLAVGVGADIAAEAGDIVLMGDPLRSLPLLVRLSRETVHVIRQNILVFALGVNAAGIVVTAWLWPLFAPAGWLESGPIVGAIYHQIGSLAVLLNSMRLLTFERQRSVVTRQRWQRIDQWIDHTFNIDELLHRLSHHWRPVTAALAALFFISYAASGFAAIQPDEVGVVRRFGRLLPDDLLPGLHWHWPWPAGSVERVKPDRVRTIEIGFRPAAGPGDSGYTWASPHGGDIRVIPDESLVVTGDGNLVEVLATVRFHIADPRLYLSAALAPEEQLRARAEAVLRESVAGRPFADLLTAGRGSLQQDVMTRIGDRTTGLGLVVDGLTMHDLHPPAEVVGAHHAVARALEDRDRQIHEAAAAATRTRRAAESMALRTVRTADAQASERVALARANADAVADWHVARTRLSSTEDVRLAVELLGAILEGHDATIAASEYRRRRAELIAIRRSLTEFRLTWDALAVALGGRAKVIVDSDRVPGRRQLLLYDPGSLPPPISPKPSNEKAPSR
jgi:Cu+-exporting ATPase